MASQADVPRWLPAALMLGAGYFVVGRVFTLPTGHGRLWRLAAWAVSGVAFAAHIRYEHRTLHSSARALAFHAAVAVAIGAFLLAVMGMWHSLSAGSGMRPSWLLALILWPAVTAVPAFLVAFVAGTLLARLPQDSVAP